MSYRKIAVLSVAAAMLTFPAVATENAAVKYDTNTAYPNTVRTGDHAPGSSAINDPNYPSHAAGTYQQRVNPPQQLSPGRTDYQVLGVAPAPGSNRAGGRDIISYPTNMDQHSMVNDGQARAGDIGRLDPSMNKNDRKAYGAGPPDAPPQAFQDAFRWVNLGWLPWWERS